MKLKPEPIDVDLYVSSKKSTEKELQELSEFIKEYKRKSALKKKHRKTAQFFANLHDKMKTIKEINQKNIPIVRIDSALDKYKKMPIFQDKVDKANEVLRKVGLPKIGVKH